MIEVRSVTKFFGRSAVLDSISINLKEGEITGLVGPSGSGKSTLLKVLGGVIQPDRGTVVVSNSGNKASLIGESGFLFQEGALFDSVSVLDNVAFPLIMPDQNFHSAKCDKTAAYERAFSMLEHVGLEKHVEKYPGQLSGGMRRRVAIARALVSRPSLVLLDDPTGGLDPVTSSRILKLIRQLQQEFSNTLVIASHDIRRLLPNVSRVVALFDGRVCYDEATGLLKSSAPKPVIDFLKQRYDFNLETAS